MTDQNNPVWWWEKRTRDIENAYQELVNHPYQRTHEESWFLRSIATKYVDRGMLRRSRLWTSVHFRNATQLSHYLKHPDEYVGSPYTGSRPVRG